MSTPMLVAHAGRLQIFVLALAIGLSACNTPSSPSTATFILSGFVRDASMSPVADALIQIGSGALAGRVTTSDALGRFQFSEAASVAEPIMLTVSRSGYLPATVRMDRTDVVVTLVSSRFPIEGDYTLTVTGANECTMLPSALRSRVYPSTIAISERINTPTVGGRFSIKLDGSDFFPELRTLWLIIRGNIANLFVSSLEAEQRWLDDVAIYERLGPNAYLSFHGTATTMMSVTDTAFATFWDGTIEHCPKSTDPFGPGYPPGCAAPAVQCRSDRHHLTASQR